MVHFAHGWFACSPNVCSCFKVAFIRVGLQADAPFLVGGV